MQESRRDTRKEWRLGFPRLQCISGRKMLVKDKDGAMNRTLHRGRDVKCKSGRLSCYKRDRRSRKPGEVKRRLTDPRIGPLGYLKVDVKAKKSRK